MVEVRRVELLSCIKIHNAVFASCQKVDLAENAREAELILILKIRAVAPLVNADNKLVWANAIIYNYKSQLAAGHSDDTSFTVSPDYGWGWLADRGYDIIQTDWTLAMCTYLNETGKRFKK